MTSNSRAGIGNRIAPWRFILFGAIAAALTPLAISLSDWQIGAMLGFDVAALVFLISLLPLFRKGAPHAMRAQALRNDANRTQLLAVTGVVMLTILVAIAAELSQRHAADPALAGLVIATLALAWGFSNAVYALHYAHLYYLPDADGSDHGGLDFPSTDEPDYWDFTYFAFTLGMTFQTSDVAIRRPGIRRAVLFHTVAAFVFNIGVLAFTINVLGG